MNTPARLLAPALCAAALLSASASAQSLGAAKPQTPNGEPAVVYADPVANEISLLRKSLQTLNTRLREISDRLLAPDAGGAAKPADPKDPKQHPLAVQLDLLARTEQRAEAMRRQLIELTEKETGYRVRVAQLEEEMRPENIDRSLVGVGTTRTSDLREYRRRQLDTERKGAEALLNQTSQSRARLDEDVRQADALVQRLRMKLYPLIEKEIDKIGPD
ncbi:MAG TPA: hypothetical protein VF736_11265 [Pyrinomonadaceae bacterium]|jgi:hypothetical protein